MADLDTLTAEHRQLTSALANARQWEELRAVYLDLAPFIGRLQGTVSEIERGPDEGEARRARDALDRLKSTARRVGLDIRLASTTALTIGLEQAISEAGELLGRLSASGIRES